MKLRNGISLLQFTVDFFVQPHLSHNHNRSEKFRLFGLLRKQVDKNDFKKENKIPIKRKESLKTNSCFLAKQLEAHKENKNFETEELKQDIDKLTKQIQTLKQAISKYHIQVKSIKDKEKEMAVNMEKQKEEIEILKNRDRDKEDKIKELERLVLETNEKHLNKIIELKAEIQELSEKIENQNRYVHLKKNCYSAKKKKKLVTSF